MEGIPTKSSFVQVTKEGVNSPSQIQPSTVPSIVEKDSDTNSDTNSEADSDTSSLFGDNYSTSSSGHSSSSSSADTQEDTQEGRSANALDISDLDLSLSQEGGKKDASDTSSTVSTTELLGRDPLFLVLSEFFMDEEGNNIIHVLQKINKNLSKLAKMHEGKRDKKSSHNKKKNHKE
jgi:hypothetical protein